MLNIYGDLKDGTHSDGRVSNSSSKSLKYLLGNSPKSYRESKYEGEPAQHSQLHENENVANELIDFLWKNKATASFSGQKACNIRAFQNYLLFESFHKMSKS